MHPTVLITGGSGGIGFELAKLYARDHYKIILVARDLSALEKNAKALREEFAVEVLCYAIDLTKATSAEELFAWLTSHSIHLDVLINNAGFGLYGAFSTTDLASETDMIALNITSLTQLTKLALTGMHKNKRGHIINVASTAAFEPGPFMSVYFATKAYVLSFSEALAEELSGSGIAVTTLCPGPTATNFEKAAAAESTSLFKGKLMTAKEVAHIAYAGIKKKQRIIITGFSNKLMVLATRFAPRTLLTKVMRRMMG